MKQAFLGIDDTAIHARDESLVFCTFRPVRWWILQSYLRAVQKEFQFLRRIVAYLFVEIEEAAVCIAYPSPATFAEGDVVDGVLIVEALVEVYELVNVELADFTQSRTAWTTALRMVETERLGVAYKRFPDTREQQSDEGIDVCIGAHGGS